MVTVQIRWRIIIAIGLSLPSAALAGASIKASFAAENAAAMDRMMIGMSAPMTGEVDRDFATMMIAHHQGAIDMARAELRYGRNPQLRRIAQAIVVEQLQEIEAMRLAASKPASAHPGGR